MQSQIISATTADSAISHLKRFRKNWDGLNSPAIRVRALKTLEGVLRNIENHKMPFPKIIPISGGGIALGWTSHGRDAELEIGPNGVMEFTFNLKTYDLSGELQEEETTSGSITSSEGVDYIMAWFSTDNAGET